VRLDLSDNPLTEEVAPALAGVLAAQPGLRALNLNDTSLTDAGIVQVCRALASAAPKLEVRRAVRHGQLCPSHRGQRGSPHCAGLLLRPPKVAQPALRAAALVSPLTRLSK
jgi:hypothetical protein